VPKPVLTRDTAWAMFDAIIYDGGITSSSKTRARRVFYAGAPDLIRGQA